MILPRPCTQTWKVAKTLVFKVSLKFATIVAWRLLYITQRNRAAPRGL